MSEFKKLNLKGPATLKAVLEAVAHLGSYDETQVAALAAEGRLQELFPFRPATFDEPIDDFNSEEEIVEASPRPLSAAQRAELMRSSLPGQGAPGRVRHGGSARAKAASGKPGAALLTKRKPKPRR